MKVFSVQIDDDIADGYAEEARERGTTVEELMASAATEMLPEYRQPLTAEQIALIEAGLKAEREGRVTPNEEVMARWKMRFG